MNFLTQIIICKLKVTIKWSKKFDFDIQIIFFNQKHIFIFIFDFFLDELDMLIKNE